MEISEMRQTMTKRCSIYNINLFIAFPFYQQGQIMYVHVYKEVIK